MKILNLDMICGIFAENTTREMKGDISPDSDMLMGQGPEQERGPHR
jgi:hypothetical protein